MTSRAWAALCAALALWAIFATWKWRAAISSAPSAAASPLLANEAVADLERVVFLRQFAEQYLNYDENSYWRNQTALAFLMSPSLRQRRLEELGEQRERRRTVSFRQSARLREVRKLGDERHLLRGELEGREADRSWKFDYEVELKLAEVPRTLENPWGIEIAEMKFNTAERDPKPRELALALAERSPALVSFPCLVENVETPADLPVQVKITSLRTSEIQFVRSGAGRSAIVTALCKDRKFPILLADASNAAVVFLGVDERDGKPRAEPARAAKKPKEAYQKTLEQELGFVIEE